jgi:hypothetical protein
MTSPIRIDVVKVARELRETNAVFISLTILTGVLAGRSPGSVLLSESKLNAISG